MTNPLPPKLKSLPASLPTEGAVRIELSEGIPIFRASSAVQNRIEELLEKQQDALLSAEEEQELDSYEEIDDYLSFVNRTIRNLSLTQI
ncbi:MAG: hypothetical protein PUP93_08445 [Rhizonema sp. NSF051]|nr:hypothetical protein [Rhizonema sp. NSF051]